MSIPCGPTSTDLRSSPLLNTPAALRGSGVRVECDGALDLVRTRAALGAEVTDLGGHAYGIDLAHSPESIARIASECAAQSVSVRSMAAGSRSLEDLLGGDFA